MTHIIQRDGRGDRILFFGRSKCDATQNLLDQMQRYGFDVTYVMSKQRGEKLPEEITHWDGDYIICFRSLFILPIHLLKKAKIAAINFHPAPPEYPGSGCINFALYDEVKSYGVTAHLMNEKVDNGKILEVRRFPVHKRDTLSSVLSRAHSELHNLCSDFITGLADSGEEHLITKASECGTTEWRGEARVMKDLEHMKNIDYNIDKTELERVIRATYIENFPPKIVLHGYNFYLSMDD